MPDKMIDHASDSATVLAAIEEAQRAAGKNDKEFVRALLQQVHGQDPGRRSFAGARSVIPLTPVVAAVRSFKIFEDPRYLANAHALALRAGGRMRVIGGARVPVNEFLDCVAVGNDSQWGCTGTLIAPKVVLTAGHCADFATRIFIGTDVTQPGAVVKVKRRVRHPQYHQGKHNDLMVLILEKSVDGVAPRTFAKKAKVDAATDGRVMGFGNTDAGGTLGYGQKRFVDVPVASPHCRGQINGEDDNVTYGCDVGLELVAGRPLLARDSCTGDSGGPFYLQQGNQWLLAAATSRATDSAMNNCGDGGVYVRVDRYRTWINSIAGVTLPAQG
ncbi:MAG: trypsin-like serine protease [Vicinamibacterales bacterium]